MRQRIRQFLAAKVRPSDSDYALARGVLDDKLYALFCTQHPRDIVHSARTARWLLERGHDDSSLLIAALLHDVGKGPQRRRDRVAWVLAQSAGLSRRAPNAGSRWEMRRALERSASHSKTSAELMREAGAPERAVELTQSHHDASPTDPVLALLQQADAAN